MFRLARSTCLNAFSILIDIPAGNPQILPIFNVSEEISFLSPADLHVLTIISVPFEENSYLVNLPQQEECLVIDPGLEPEKIIRRLQREGLTPSAILITHGHSDHIAGSGTLREIWTECPLIVGKEDAPKLTDPSQNLSAMFGLPLICPPADRTVEEGDVLTAAGITLKILSLPGHSRGHVVYQVAACDPPLCFVGDVIFAGGIGRTDFPDGDFQQLIEGIRQKLFTLPDETVLYPGHGPATTVGREKRLNPFVAQE
jgi:hydroxyacylglutathione hydrolase